MDDFAATKIRRKPLPQASHLESDAFLAFETRQGHLEPQHQRESSQHVGEIIRGYNLARQFPAADDTGLAKEIAGAAVPYDVSLGTRTGCIVATAVGAAASLACLVGGIVVLARNPTDLVATYYMSTPAILEAVSLLVNVGLTLCLDAMMFVHSVSLRWALFHEGRLAFNTNLRLLSSARRFGPNAWYVNAVTAACLILSYAASSTMFMQAHMQDEMQVNGAAVVAMGIGLAGQASVSAWCLWASRSRSNSILTWSANPLNATLAALHHGHLQRRSGRSMLSVHDDDKDAEPGGVRPKKRQASMYRAHKGGVRGVVVLLWALSVLAVLAPAGIAVYIYRFGGSQVNDFGFSPDQNNSAAAASLPAYPCGVQAVLLLLFYSLVQGLQTVALHCAELLVNLSRDEAVWRRAYDNKKNKNKKFDDGGKQKKKKGGAAIRANPFAAAAASWENAVLFVAKVVLHWLIGQSLLVRNLPMYRPDYSGPERYGYFLQAWYHPLVLYAGLAIALAAFGTFIALRRRKGSQPAAYGHMPTLANLVDDWTTDEKGRMWWGDASPKQLGLHVRRAGTSSDPGSVGRIRSECLYA